MPSRIISKALLLSMVFVSMTGPMALAQTQQTPAALEVEQVEPQATPPAVPQQAAPADAVPPSQAQVPATQTLASPVPDIEAPAIGATPDTAVAEQPTGNPALPHDLSPMGMFLAADIVVKGVMGALALASVATWAILVFKVFELAGAKRRMKKAVRALTAAAGLREIREGRDAKKGPAGAMVTAAVEELTKSEAVLDLVSAQGVKERVASHLTRIEAGAGKKIAVGTGILATIGSISPFVGLFGTVWGIMNSFIGISQAQTTNLAIVAPGIAEALLATAIGLVAAIPAVVIYNYFARSIGGYRVILADASAAVERLVSRDLDFRQARRMAPGKRDGHAHQGEPAIARIG